MIKKIIDSIFSYFESYFELKVKICNKNDLWY